MLIQRDQEGNGRNDGGGNVQILERAVCVGKDQMITLAENGMKKLQQGIDQAERHSAEEKMACFCR